MKNTAIEYEILNAPFWELNIYSFLGDKLFMWHIINNHNWGKEIIPQTPPFLNCIDFTLLLAFITIVMTAYTIGRRAINIPTIVIGFFPILGNLLLTKNIDPNKILFEGDLLGNSLVWGTLIISLSITLIYLIWAHFWKEEFPFSHILSILFITLSTYIIMAANDILPMYLGIEILAFSLYVLGGGIVKNLRNTESVLKYFINSAIFSMIFILGGGILFYYISSTNFIVIRSYMELGTMGDKGWVINLAFLLLFLATLGKIGVTPFHMPFVDIYSSINRKSALLFIIIPKIPYLWIINIILFLGGGENNIFLPLALTVMIIVNMGVGAIMAFSQNNIHRFIAYSVIFNNGFLLAQVLSGHDIAWVNTLTFIIIYMLILMSIFTLIGTYKIESISQMKYLDKYSLPAIIMVTSFVNLMGIPPLSLFPPKFIILSSLIEGGYIIIAIIIIIISSISIYYYLRIIKNIYFTHGGERDSENINSPLFPLPMSIILPLLFLSQFIYLIYPHTLIIGITYLLI